MKQLAMLLVSLVCLSALSGVAKDAPKPNPFKEILSPIPPAELPAKAGDLVKRAKARDWVTTTINVVKAAVEINPAATPAVVGAIARAVPDMAATAAEIAAELQPKQASAIARAAVAAAPSKAGKVVAAVCRAVPSEYKNVAIAASEVAPTAGKEILYGVASALPDSKPYIEKAMAGYAGATPSVATTLNQGSRPTSLALSSPASSAPVGKPIVRGPTTGPPYVPPGTTPPSVNPTNGGTVPTGGRNYAEP